MPASYILVILAGFFLGSVLNSCIDHISQSRLSDGQIIHCKDCRFYLMIQNIMPFLCYLFSSKISKGCEDYKTKLSRRQLVFQLLYAILLALIFHRYGFSIHFFEYGAMAFFLIAIAAIDLKTMEIPDKIILIGFISAGIFIVIRYILFKDSLILHFSGFLAGGGIFLLIALITKAMGGGDIKLMALLGFWVGIRSIFTIVFLSFFIAAIFSIILLITGKKGRKDFIPFGPFISMAAFLVAVFEDELWHVWFLLF